MNRLIQIPDQGYVDSTPVALAVGVEGAIRAVPAVQIPEEELTARIDARMWIPLCPLVSTAGAEIGSLQYPGYPHEQ
jgi:hypothetical protein